MPRRRWLYFLPAFIWLAITLPSISQGDYGSDSAWYTAIGVQAWRTGELWTLYGPPGQPYFNKPPLPFWIHGLVAWVFGPGVWQARLPTVLAGLVSVLLTVRLVRAYAGELTACAAGVILAFTYEFFRRSFEVSLDAWQLLFLLASIVAVVEGTRAVTPKDFHHGANAEGHGEKAVPARIGRCFAMAGAAIGLALLCKPLVALMALPLLAIWLALEKQWRAIAWLGLSGLVAVLVAAPWHGSMILLHGGFGVDGRGGEFVKQYFGAEVAARAAGEITASAMWNKPWWFYLEQLGSTGWPWLLLALLAALDLMLGKMRPSVRPLVRLAIVWFVGWLVVLSLFPDRRDRYAVVLHPAMAVLAATWLDGKRAFAERGMSLLRLSAVCATIAGVGMFIAVLADGKIHRKPDPQWRELFAFLRTQPWVTQTSAASTEGAVPTNASGTQTLWAAGLSPHRNARIYLEFGRWAKPARDRWNALVIDPALDVKPGDLLLYHRRDGWTPGVQETQAWSNKDLVVTQTSNGWAPLESQDPGE